MTEAREYIYKQSSLLTVKPDQTVIIKKQLFQYFPGIKSTKKQDEQKAFEPSDEWYPSVNSYYPFTEDVDAFARVHHLLEAKKSSDSIENCHVSEPVNEYGERRALLQYLYSRPICFLILGKPGLGQEEVGRRLAQHWKCEYIDPLTLLEEEIASGSRPGQCIEFNLRCGRSIGIDVLTRLLAKKVQTESVLHRGFVCCGFPLIPNDLYEEDPISSESAVFNVREIFDEIVDHSIRLGDISNRVLVSLKSSSIDSESKSENEEPPEEGSGSIKMEWSIENGICAAADIGTDLERQINCIFGFCEDPYMLIYIYGKSSDVVTKRADCYLDIYSNKSVDLQKIKMFYEVGASNEQLTEDLFGNGNNPFTLNPTLKHLVRIPENFPANVSTQLDRYHSSIANSIDCYVALHLQEYYIKLDGRTYISQMMDLVKLRLNVLPLQPVLIPQGFDSSNEIVGEGVEQNEIEQMTPEDAFVTLSRRDTVAPVFKWTWSNWGTFCPVSMFRGVYQKGSSKLAVHFVDKIYFLADEICYKKFIDNPRHYLLPPFPRPGPNIFVFGPPVSGKTAVAKCLGYLLNSKVLTPAVMHQEYLKQAIDQYKEQVKQLAMAEAMEILKERISREADERQKKVEEWKKEVTDILKKLELVCNWNKRKSLGISSFPMKMEEEIISSVDSDEIYLTEEEVIRQRLGVVNIPANIDREYCAHLLQDNNVLKHLPDDLKKEASPPSVHDPFVLEYANKKVEEIHVDEIEEVKENIYDMYIHCIRTVEREEQYAGCIIDGMTTDIPLLQQLREELTIDDVIVLRSSDINFLVDRFKTRDKYATEFCNYRNFFLGLKEENAAWRVPSDLSTVSYKEGVACNILSEVLAAGFDEETIKTEREVTLQQYEQEVNLYETEIKEVLKVLDQFDLKPFLIDPKGLSMEELLKQAVSSLRDRYRISASEFTDADRAEEMQQFLSQMVQGGEGEGEGTDQGADEFFAKNRRYGDTYCYDPVTFATKFVLWRGKDRFTAKFKDKVYLFGKEANMRSFIKSPRRYLLQFNPPDRFPPPRICIVGPNADLTSKVSKSLAKNMGVRYLNYVEMKTSAINAFSSISLFVRSTDEDVELPESLIYVAYDSLLDKLFVEEPEKYNGFVIDGFPKSITDLNYIVSNEAIPDVVLCATLDREENLKRRLEKSLKDWKETMEDQRKDQQIVNSILRDEWKENRRNRYNELIEAKRQNRYSKKISEEPAEQNDDETGLKSDTQISMDSITEQQDQDEVTKILDEEFPEPDVFEINEESEEEVIEKFTNEIETNYDGQTRGYQEIKQMCENENINFIEIDGNEEFEKVIRRVYMIGNEAKFRNPSFFERCYEVSLGMAEELLETGYCFLSSFGRICPVQYYDEQNLLHMFLGGKENNKIHPIIHRHYIYFVYGEENSDRFCKNPLRYINVKKLPLCLIPARVAIIGPPKSGKTSLANRMKRDFGFNTVSRGQAIRATLSNPLFVNLINKVEEILRKGDELTDELVMECVQAGSSCGEAVTQGLIFDGFPNTITEMYAMSRLGLVPHLIFDLQIPEESLFKQAMIPNGKNLQFSERFFSHLVEEWKKNQDIFRSWCDREYQNIYKLPVDRSIWGVWERAKDTILSVMFERKHYYMHVKLNWPLRLANMLVTPLEFLERQSAYKTYCPGCLYYEHKLSNGGDPPDRTGLVHYGKHFYWLCENHIDNFLKKPDKFLPPSNICLPQDLPEVVFLTEEPKNPVEDGYCVVCYKNNFPKKILNKGTLDYVVSHKGKIYMFDSADCLTSFMESPEKFFEVTINFKGGDISVSLEYRDLPVMGMLEQYVARTLVRAVNHVNVYRPVIPGLSISQAALICVGLNLKAHNTEDPNKEKYVEALQVFHQYRLDLTKYLDMIKKYLNPFVHYEEPDTPSSTDVEIEEK